MATSDFFEDDFAHGDEGRAGSLGVLDEVFPAVGIVLLEDDGGDFFGDVAVEAAHAVAGDEGHHVVFERDEIVGLHSGLLSQKPVCAAQGIGWGFARVFPAGERGKDVTLRDIVEERQMIFSKDYVGYLARQTVKHLVAEKMIHTEKPVLVNERVGAAMIDELSLEDRINDEVRVILEAFQDDMRKTGASYPEMFKKVKNELARKYKAVL